MEHNNSGRPVQSKTSLLRVQKENIISDLPPLRDSLFPGVPPFLNYIPVSANLRIFPLFELREQLWRVPQAIGHILATKVKVTVLKVSNIGVCFDLLRRIGFHHQIFVCLRLRTIFPVLK